MTKSDTVVDLHPMFFQRQPDDGPNAVYQAHVRYGDAPDAPVFALTVITGSPGDGKARAEFEAFLREIRASFALAPPDQDDRSDGGQDPEQINLGTDVLFKPGWLRPPSDQPDAGIEMTIQAMVGTYTKLEEIFAELVTSVLHLLPPSASRLVGAYFSVPQGGCHEYQSNLSGKATVRVHCRSGYIMVSTVNPIGQYYWEYSGHTTPSFKARTIAVTGERPSKYTLKGKFHKIY